MSDLLQDIARNIIEGRADRKSPWPEERRGEPGVKELTEKAVEEGISVQNILNSGLLAGMDVVGSRFKVGDLFIPEVLVCAKALEAGMEILRPIITRSGLKPLAKFVIGTVAGDIHDIGKNLVKMMLAGAGFEVIDAGIDVPKEKFVEIVRREKPQILGMSSLLTTSMVEMRPVIEALEKAMLRKRLRIMVGGAPITESYAKQISADGYAPDAISAVTVARKVLEI